MCWRLQLWIKQDIVFKLFQPEELECLICGSTELDFDALEGAVQYESGFSVDSQVDHIWLHTALVYSGLLTALAGFAWPAAQARLTARVANQLILTSAHLSVSGEVCARTLYSSRSLLVLFASPRSPN